MIPASTECPAVGNATANETSAVRVANLSIATFTSLELTASTGMLGVPLHHNIGESGRVSAILTGFVAIEIVIMAQK
jgi:hypothetical protein